MRINWKVRLKNKTFWLLAIPAVLLLAQQVMALFGINFVVEELQESLLRLVNSIFSLLVVLGVVVDPTTEGTCDSCEALEYDEPKPKAVDYEFE